MTDEHRIVANTSYRIVAEVVSKLVSVAFYVVLAREVGDADFGVFTFALAFVALVTTLANFGQDAVLTREVAPRHELVDRYFANTLALKTGLALLALAVALGVTTLAGMAAETRWVILLLGLAVTAETLMATVFASFQAFDRLGFIPVVLVWQRTVTTAVAIPLLLLGAGVVTGAAVYLGGAISALLLALVFFLGRVVRPRLRVEPKVWWSLMRPALPVGIGSVFSTTLFRIDAALLAAFATNAVVGHYGAAYRIFEATLFLSWSVTAAAYPVFARLGPEAPLRLTYERTLKLALLPTLPLAVGAAVLGRPLIELVFGEEFAPGGTALMLLAPAIALYPVEHVAGAFLIARRRQNIVAAVMGLVALENIAANLIFIPAFSLNAAALNTSISELLLALAFLTVAAGTAGGLDWRRVFTGPAVAALAAAVAMLLLNDWILVAAGAGGVVYLLTLAFWERRAFPEDARLLSDFFLRRA